MKTLSLLTKLPLEQLLALCMREEPSAQKELYRRYSGKFYSICLRYLREQAEAEDCMITAFTKIFQNIKQYKATGNFEAWMRRIVVNQCLSQLEKKKYLYFDINGIQSIQIGISEMASSSLHTQELLRLVQNLPTGYRTVFNLFAIEGYSHKEIASRLGISESTSKTQYLRAKEQLQNQIHKINNIQSYVS